MKRELALWPPLSSSDFSVWIAFVAIILLVTTELLSPRYGSSRIVLNRKRLRAVALVVALIFLGTLAYTIFEMLTK